MPLLDPAVRAAWQRTPTSVMFWMFLSTVTMAVGVALLAGSPSRVSSPAFISIREYGGPLTWGVAFAVIGVLIGISPFLGARFLMMSLAAASALYLLMAAGFVAAAVEDDRAAILGPIFALIPAGFYALHSWHYRRAAMDTSQ